MTELFWDGHTMVWLIYCVFWFPVPTVTRSVSRWTYWVPSSTSTTASAWLFTEISSHKIYLWQAPSATRSSNLGILTWPLKSRLVRQWQAADLLGHQGTGLMWVKVFFVGPGQKGFKHLQRSTDLGTPESRYPKASEHPGVHRPFSRASTTENHRPNPKPPPSHSPYPLPLRLRVLAEVRHDEGRPKPIFAEWKWACRALKSESTPVQARRRVQHEWATGLWRNLHSNVGSAFFQVYI